MADDRIHPGKPPVNKEEEKPLSTTKPSFPPPGSKTIPISFPPDSAPPPGTYIVQFPKDQIIRPAPPPPCRPPNQHRQARSCCCCYCLTLNLILITAILVAVFFLVSRPKAPQYSVDKLSIRGFNLTSSSSTTYSPSIQLTVAARNPNNNIAIYYTKGSSIALTHSGVQLCSGVLPLFYQPTNNLTVFQTALKGSGLKFSTVDYEALRREQRNGDIPLRLDLKVPVQFKVSSIKTWTVTVKVRCYITVNKLTTDASIVSNNCDIYSIKPWE